MKSNISIDYDAFFHLPHTRAEGDWMEDRLKTLSATETIILAGALQQNRPETVVDAINLLATLNDYSVRFPATNVESLAQFYFAQNSLKLPDLVLKHTHMEPLGIAFQDEHPGVFVADYYVMEPAEPTGKPYDGHNLQDIKDWSWNVKIRLASHDCPDGVWIRLPDYSNEFDGSPKELAIAMRELNVTSVRQCSVLDARCTIPEAEAFLKEYDDPVVLLCDGSKLGFLLDEQAQGLKQYEQKLAAAMEYVGCQSLQDILDCAEGIRLFDFVMADRIDEYAYSELEKAGAPDILIDGGLFDLKGFAEESLAQNGYTLDSTGSMYINAEQWEQRYRQSEMNMQM